jgi:hypothetical protein
MDILDIESKIVIQELEARKQRLQELKEEMKDLLFEEFIEKQGDFMDVEVNRKGFIFGNVLNKLSGYYLTEEEDELKQKGKITNIQSIQSKYMQKIAIAEQKGSKSGCKPNEIKIIVEELEKARDKEIAELKDNPLEFKIFYDKKYEEELEYIKLEKTTIENNDILKHFGQEVINSDAEIINYCIKLDKFIHKPIPEFESRFWKYVSDNNGFKFKDKTCVCWNCGRVPKITRVFNYSNDKYQNSIGYLSGLLEYREIFDRIQYKNYNCSGKKVIRSGKIKYITCCSFLYDFEEKKMYKTGYPGKKYEILTGIGLITDNQYIPCEEYDFKTKKDLWEEMQLMKERLSKIEIILSKI